MADTIRVYLRRALRERGLSGEVTEQWIIHADTFGGEDGWEEHHGRDTLRRALELMAADLDEARDERLDERIVPGWLVCMDQLGVANRAVESEAGIIAESTYADGVQAALEWVIGTRDEMPMGES